MKMAGSDSPQGYLCEFRDLFSDDFYCKKCTLVARKLTITSCCGESYCHACIADIQQQALPCPACGQQNFNIFEHIKYQRQLEGSQVYCNMKGRGCDWLGPLDQLDAHLDLDCQYVDIKCPLNCRQTISKNMVEQHMEVECVMRDYVCQYCAFKATYEVVVDTHWPKCIYLPLQCPNLCGMTCERDVMDNHMRVCPLEEVACEFCKVGCDKSFRRKDQEEHTRQNSQKHLTMIAAAVVYMNQQLQQKLQEVEHTLHEEEQKLEQKIQEQEHELEKKLKLQKQMLQNLECKLQEENKKHELEEQKLEQKIQEQEQKIQEQEQRLEKKLEDQEQNFQGQLLNFQKLLQKQDKKLTCLQKKSNTNEILVGEVAKNILDSKRLFVMKNFSKEKARDSWNDWKSSAMYTHFHGYKFCIGIDANGDGPSRGKAMRVYLCAMQGEYDHELKWLAKASFTIEMINQKGGDNVEYKSGIISWTKPDRLYRCMFSFGSNVSGVPVFLEHSKLDNFLHKDTLCFHLTCATVY